MEEIICSELSGKHAKIGHLHLNRPKALNACTQSICKTIHAQLNKWQQDDNIKAVVITGEGNKAFCAGGDIRMLYDHKESPELAETFFKVEYANNLAIANFSKPYIAWLDGITMGGGIGLSVYGSHRIATENTLIAMPETAIGLFPDVGGGYFLPRLPSAFGWYLGLTGTRLNPVETLTSTLATHLLPSDQFDDFMASLLQADFTNDPKQTVDDCLASCKQSHAAFTENANHLKEREADIKHCFQQPTLQACLQALEHTNNEWSQNVLKRLSHCSPTSLHLTFEQLSRGNKLSLADDLAMELCMTKHVLKQHDFFEGVRAMLVDKDKKPRWQPESIDNVSMSEIQGYFMMTSRKHRCG